LPCVIHKPTHSIPAAPSEIPLKNTGLKCSSTLKHGIVIPMDEIVNKRKLPKAEAAEAAKRLAMFRAISAVEGLSPDAEMVELFARFEREQWSHERRRAYIQSQFAKQST
jgi:hypothetical protein